MEIVDLLRLGKNTLKTIDNNGQHLDRWSLMHEEKLFHNLFSSVAVVAGMVCLFSFGLL